MEQLVRQSFTIASIIMIQHHFVDYNQELFKTTTDFQQNSFDFIIVGAGPSGSLLTSRLVNSGFSVLLLESGGETNPLLRIPVLHWPFQQENPYNNYGYYSAPQTNTHWGYKNGQNFMASGKALGGSSIFGALLWSRGHKNDYDNWANITKDDSWSYDNLEKYFQRPLETIGVTEEETELGNIFHQAGKEFGFKIWENNRDFEQEGFHSIKYMKKGGLRFSIYELFVKPLIRMGNPLLTVRKFSTVSKILLTEDNEAYGVEYLQFGVRKTAKCFQEVIVSGGAIESPKLLMLSGIGPAVQMAKFNIPLKIELPVGFNLQDRFATLMAPITIKSPLTFSPQFLQGGKILSDFLSERKGPLGFTGYTSAAYVTSTVAKARGEENHPDLEILLMGASQSDPAFVRLLERMFNMQHGVLESAFKHAYGKHSFVLVPQIGRPKSKGRLTLRSKNPLDPPLIDPQYLSHEDDLNALIEGMEIANRLINETQAFQSIGASLPENDLDACRNFEIHSRDYSECYLRTVGVPGWDPTGTCRMGFGPGDPAAVVDSQLRVIGAKRLRVVDSSVIPVIPRSAPLWPILMIAEKTADVLINQYSTSTVFVIT